MANGNNILNTANADRQAAMPVPIHARDSSNVPAVYDPMHAYGVREGESEFRNMWLTVLKYRLTIVLFAAVVIVTTFIGNLMMRPVYRASALIEVRPNASQVVKLENVESIGGGGKDYLWTEFNIIRSASVGLAVIDRLELWNDPEISGHIQQRGFTTGLAQIKKALTGSPEQPAGQALAPDEPVDRQALARSRFGAYQQRMSVEPVNRSYLFKINFESFDPKLAAQVSNVIAEEYTRLNDQRRFSSTNSAKSFLNDEIKRLQAKLETSERELYEFARRFQVVDVEDSNNIMASRLASLNDELSRVRSQRIGAESLFLQAKDTPAQFLPQLLDEPLVVQLKNQYAELQSEYYRLSKVFKEKYPSVQQVKAEMDQVQSSLREEIKKLVNSLAVSHQQLKRREQLLEAEVDNLKVEIFELQDRAVQYNILKREWEANRELYTGLLDRLKEVGVASGLEVNNVAIIDRAAPPGGPFKPDLKTNLLKASMWGIVGGLALAFLLGFLDNTIRTSEELEQLLHISNLGLVPLVKGGGADGKRFKRKRELKGKQGESLDVRKLDLMSSLVRDSELAEAYRSIRTSLMFSTPESAPRIMLVTSASSGEGKTTAAINLATVFAQNGEKVLLVDGDLRKPRTHKTFGMHSKPGLTDCLLREPMQQIAKTPIKGVSLMPAGTTPPNPAELLSSTNFDQFLQRVKEQYTRVIIDAPPVLGLADAVIASAKVDGVLLVVSAGKVSKDGLRQSVKRLRAVYAPLVGCVLNNVDVTSLEYGEYSRYYYSYNPEDDGKVRKMDQSAAS